MRERQSYLEKCLVDNYNPGIDPGREIFRNDLTRMGLLNEVERVYLKLGGVLNEVPLRFGGWDIVLNDFIVELDEEQHFNRFRAETLDSFIYHVVKGFDPSYYKNHCRDFETECLRKANWGKYWKTDSTERQFGISDKLGLLEENGSSRWKQRAFYDFLKDVFSIIYNQKLIRISIYDQTIYLGRIKTIGEILSGSNPAGLNELIKFIDLKRKLQ